MSPTPPPRSGIQHALSSRAAVMNNVESFLSLPKYVLAHATILHVSRRKVVDRASLLRHLRDLDREKTCKVDIRDVVAFMEVAASAAFSSTDGSLVRARNA